MHFADLVALAGVVEYALGRGGLARVDVRHDPDVAIHGQRDLAQWRRGCGLEIDFLLLERRIFVQDDETSTPTPGIIVIVVVVVVVNDQLGNYRWEGSIANGRGRNDTIAWDECRCRSGKEEH